MEFNLTVFYSSFSHLFQYDFSLSDSKFPHIFRTLLSILADLKRAMIWIISILPLISSSSSFFSNPLETFQGHQPQLLWRPPSRSTVFSTLRQDSNICISFCFLTFSHNDSPERQYQALYKFSPCKIF